jgi:hypothetical protein
MLSENQIKRLLKHCEKILNKYTIPLNNSDDKTIIGWCQALRLVLQKDTYIREDSILLSSCCSDIPVGETHEDTDLNIITGFCSECHEHADFTYGDDDG